MESGSSVLDLGCGDGELLALLVKEKGVKAKGIDINEHAIYECIAKGLSVLHGDIDKGLLDYADKSFDYVILNQTFQQLRKPDAVLREALRVGKEAIVSFPNFAHFSARLQIFFAGRTPVTQSLPHKWYDTPNLHFLSISDFVEYCKTRNIHIKRAEFLSGDRKIHVFPNLRALVGIFLITGGQTGRLEG